jgi:thymidylate synthase ThyX
MLKVTLIDFTGRGYAEYDQGEYAARLLAFTKNTRLQMTPDGFDEWLRKPWSEIEPEVAYMANTIPSSWEFVDATFTIQNVTRACAQQITRTRFTPMDGDIFGSYAMQSQRVTDMSEVTYDVPPGVIEAGAATAFAEVIDASMDGYNRLLGFGVDLQDARGVLPMNSHCNLVVKYNLRQMADMFRKRESLRVQGEFVDIVRLMRAAVEQVWPWSAPFFVPKDQKAIEIIERIAASLSTHDQRELAKAADLIKGGT